MNNLIWLFSALAGFMIWVSQKQVERKMKIFDDAVNALIRYQNEGGSYELQNKHYSIDKKRRTGPYLTDETVLLIERSMALVSEFFSDDVASNFIKLLKSIRLEYSNTDIQVGPAIIGTLSIPELNDVIHDLNNEVAISYMFRRLICKLLHY
ncbi:MAG: hypothetical protein P4L43_12000 [Syntrophobacteraceae bacterium]|nr:hypothetical protein [Syntrophobacteraceae bacterium]